MQKALRKYLLQQTAITDRVGSGGVYSGSAPQNARRPYIVIHKLGSNENETLATDSGSLRFMDFDIDCKAARYGQAQDLLNEVRTLLKDYSGAAGDETIGAVLINGETDDIEPPTDGSDIDTAVCTLDVQIHWNPA